MEDSRPLKTLLIVLFVIILAVIITMIYFLRDKTPYGLPVEFSANNEMTEVAEAEEPLLLEEPEDDPFESPTVPERFIVDRHTVVKDESFSLVTGIYWDDVYLWPDLYIRNDMKSDDPDIIYPDEIIDIYNRLGKGNVYNDIEKDEILKAYIEVYDIYKKLGPDKENSVWALLYSGAKYDHSFLELFSDRIDPADKAMAQKYIDEEGYLD
ncbi:hypothetical protein [Spirochaeta isovalerica]|uniref:Uncharacterized protein n=1 Tax=Spirochaeta isovalerica TaxID=150 RepID=A0A841RGY4_9SPIO|nr:hypothetical protein [Spirochaeta isovalerica]MBB6482641.1 hypothetical protein [Spirochaeta isovalerica]